MMDFKELEKQGKTLIYKETKTDDRPSGWEFWGKRISEDEEVYVWRKIVSIEDAEKYELENSY